MGRDGVLLAGPNSKFQLNLLVAYIGLLCRELFIRNFFVRTFILDDSLKKIRALIMAYQKDPNNIQRIRNMLNDASRDIILLKEVLEYLKESLEEMPIPPVPAGEGGRRLFKVLDAPTMKGDIMMRANDLVKLIEGARNQLVTLQQMTDVINTKQLEDVFKNVEANTKYLVDASAATERSRASLEVMQIILAGSFAFDIIDRLSGGTLNIVVPNWIEDYIVRPVISVPGLFWILNMVWLFAVSVALTKLMKHLGSLASGALTLRVKVNRKVDIEKLREWCALKRPDVTDSICEIDTKLKKMAWTETDSSIWEGATPDIEVLYDDKYGFLLIVFFQINSKRTTLREKGLMRIFTEVLLKEGIFEPEDGDKKALADAGITTAEEKDETTKKE